MPQSPITCHVLDSSTGLPAEGVSIRLQALKVTVEDNLVVFQPLAEGITNKDGRCTDLLPPAGSREEKSQRTELSPGQSYKLVFETKDYFERTKRESFYPWVEITFSIAYPIKHYHIPLIISPYGFTTYRGS